MFRSSISALNSSLCNSSGPTLQSVRWRRKPRWIPTAKSKIFRIPEKQKQPEDEKLELLRLHNNYKTQMRSIRSFFRDESVRLSATSSADHLILTPEEEEAELQRCLDENNEWNAKICELREARSLKESEEKENEIHRRLEAKVLRDEEALEKIEEIVRIEKEGSRTFVDKENLDQAIEFALANPVDVNFAIDLQKNIFAGRNTSTDVVNKDHRPAESEI